MKPMPPGVPGESSGGNLGSQSLQGSRGILREKSCTPRPPRDPGEASGDNLGSQGLQEFQGKPQGNFWEAKASRSARGSLTENSKREFQGAQGRAKRKASRTNKKSGFLIPKQTPVTIIATGRAQLASGWKACGPRVDHGTPQEQPRHWTGRQQEVNQKYR